MDENNLTKGRHWSQLYAPARGCSKCFTEDPRWRFTDRCAFHPYFENISFESNGLKSWKILLFHSCNYTVLKYCWYALFCRNMSSTLLTIITGKYICYSLLLSLKTVRSQWGIKSSSLINNRDIVYDCQVLFLQRNEANIYNL
jgi:hypothetical protein